MNHCSVCERANIALKPDAIGGRIRGHLCGNCQHLITYMQANAWWLRQALNYLGYTVSR